MYTFTQALVVISSVRGANGEEALMFLNANAGEFDFLLIVCVLDINMPLMDRWQLGDAF